LIDLADNGKRCWKPKLEEKLKKLLPKVARLPGKKVKAKKPEKKAKVKLRAKVLTANLKLRQLTRTVHKVIR
jgi:hypothetical protein